MKLSAFSFKPEEVPLPNGTISYIGKLSAAARANWWNTLSRETKEDNLAEERLIDSAQLILLTLVDESGKRILTDSPEDLEEVKNLPSDVFDLLAKKSIQINGLDKESSEDNKKK